MRKKVLIITVVVMGLVGGWMLVVLQISRINDPAVIVNKLRKGRGDRVELLMKLELARGDVVEPMIKAVLDEEAPVGFRCDMIDGLLRQYQSDSSDQRITDTLLQLREDSKPQIRREVVYGFALYGNDSQKVEMIDMVDDPDQEVRRQVYMIFSALKAGEFVNRQPWRFLSEQQKQILVEAGVKQMNRGQDEELKYLARAVVGRRIEELCYKAMRKRQSGDMEAAEEILAQAIQLDPNSQQAKIHIIRHWMINDKARALELADEYGALMRIPQLSQAPVIDGDPTEDVWKEGFTSDRFYLTVARLASKLSDGKSRFYIGHYQGKIYVTVIGYEQELDKLTAKCTQRDGKVPRDDCVELFFDPSAVGTDFSHFIINTVGTLRDLKDRKARHNFDCEYKVKVFEDRGYWACEFAIDISQMTDEEISSESVWGINIVRVRIGPASEHCIWWPTYGHVHRMELWPFAVFEMDEQGSGKRQIIAGSQEDVGAEPMSKIILETQNGVEVDER